MSWGNVPRAKELQCYEIYNEMLCQCIKAIAGPFYNIMKVMKKGPNKHSNTNIYLAKS